MLELGRQLPVDSDRRPIVRPRPVAVASQIDHRLDGEAHARLGGTDSFALAIVGNVGRCVEELVDTVTAVTADNTAISRLGQLLDHISRFAEQHAWLHHFDRIIEAVACCLDHAHGVWVCLGFLSDIISFI